MDAAKQLFSAWKLQGKLPLREVYSIFQGPCSHLQWMKPLLDGIIVPQHAFISTLAAHKALPTVDNICSRGMLMVNRCVLCGMAMENHQHLFFSCSYSTKVMQGLLIWQGYTRRILSLKHELYKLARYKCKTWRKKLACCALAAGIYGLWHERNRRIFVGQSRSVEQLLRWIKYCVCVRMYAWQKGILSYDVFHVLVA
ncbi:uncharacterized protein LOC141600708 [Silene latifolia]|uniref:uncharacterized protein LOC141600708 n=1 Tax=Silene latifolia TaxID=37657 RepID=UPI003D7709E9